MNNDQGFFLFWRKFWFGEIARLDDATQNLFLRMISEANHSDVEFGHHTIKRGSFICANSNLIERLYHNQGCAPSLTTLKKRIKELEAIDCVKRKQIKHKGRTVTLYVITNYEQHQLPNDGRGSNINPHTTPHTTPRATPRATPYLMNNNKQQITRKNNHSPSSLRDEGARDPQKSDSEIQQAGTLFEGTPTEPPPRQSLDDQRFDRFWSAVKRKLDKGTARKHFPAAVKAVAQSRALTRDEATEFLITTWNRFESSKHQTSRAEKFRTKPWKFLKEQLFDDDQSLWNEDHSDAKNKPAGAGTVQAPAGFGQRSRIRRKENAN